MRIVQQRMVDEKIAEEVEQFLGELFHPEGFGFSVTEEVRKEAKLILEKFKGQC